MQWLVQAEEDAVARRGKLEANLSFVFGGCSCCARSICAWCVLEGETVVFIGR